MPSVYGLLTGNCVQSLAKSGSAVRSRLPNHRLQQCRCAAFNRRSTGFQCRRLSPCDQADGPTRPDFIREIPPTNGSPLPFQNGPGFSTRTYPAIHT